MDCIKNGLLDLKRDVLLRICKLSWDKPDQIRKLIGVCGESYEWKKHTFFIQNRPNYIPISFGDCVGKVCKFTHTPLGIQYTFTCDCNDYQSVFLDKSISTGIFRWTVQIKYTDGGKYSCLLIGALPTFILKNFCTEPWVDSPWVDYLFVRKPFHNWSFRFCKEGLREESTSTDKLPELIDISHKCNVPDDSLVSLESDLDAHNLSLFVGGNKTRQCFSGVHGPLTFGLSGCNGPSFLSVSFLRLPRATPAPMPATSSPPSLSGANEFFRHMYMNTEAEARVEVDREEARGGGSGGGDGDG